jgi:hypothetical protein
VTTVALYPVHEPGQCQECDRARQQSPVWSTAHDPAGCPDCYILATATAAPAPVPYTTAPQQTVQTGLAKPAAQHPNVSAPLDHHGQVRLPSADSSGRRPAVTRPASTRRPGQ